MDRDWTGKLKDRLQDYEEDIPEGLWSAISGTMARRKRRRRAVYAASALSAAAAAVLAVYFNSGGFIINDRPSTVQELVAEQKSTAEPAPDVKPDMLNEDNAADKGTNWETAWNTTEVSGEPATYGTPDIMPSCTEDSDADSLSSQTGGTVQNDSSEKRETEGQAYDRGGVNENESLFADIPERKKNRRRGTLHASISASNLTGSGRNYSAYAGLASASILSSRQNNEQDENQGAVMLKSAPASSSPEPSGTKTEIRHRQPVRAGISIRYDFAPRWGIETGLTYSLLSSSIYSVNGDYSYRTGQDLHYIGIPLKFSYDFLRLGWFSMYVTAGGMMEKCVSGRSDTDYLYGGQTISSSTRHIAVKPLQWSVNASAGAEFHISPLVGIYIEPGISYFFNDNSGVSTIYKDKPLNFNLELGLRFSFR